MMFEETSFGSITISGKKFNHDIYLFTDRTIHERDKTHSKHIGGHRELSKWELEQLLIGEPEILIIGMGQSGVLPMSTETKSWLEFITKKANIQILQELTPNVLKKTNDLLKSEKKFSGVFHVTC